MGQAPSMTPSGLPEIGCQEGTLWDAYVPRSAPAAAPSASPLSLPSVPVAGVGEVSRVRIRRECRHSSEEEFLAPKTDQVFLL
jgi:hypothetical protein